MSFRDTLIASQQERFLIFEVVAAEGADVLNFTTYNGPPTIDWGDGTPTESGSELTHTYAQYGTFFVKIICPTMTRLMSVSSTVNIKRCNESWGKQHGSLRLQFHLCPNSELLLESIPAGGGNWSDAFSHSEDAVLPIRHLPDTITNMTNICNGDNSALMPFNELPSSLAGSNNNMFCDCRAAVFTITSIPEAVTSLNSAFFQCYEADIRLNKLPDGIQSLYRTFRDAYKTTINLDELVANAPEGGYQALTDIDYAFAGCPNVTGSRSRFLAACPNLESSSGAFNDTNTTE